MVFSLGEHFFNLSPLPPYPAFPEGLSALCNNSFFFIFIYFMYMNISPACLYVHPKCAQWQWTASNLLELKLQVVVSAMWVLRIKPRSSGRAVSILNH